MAQRNFDPTNFKEAVLVLCILYFFGLAFALQLHAKTFGLEHPLPFFIFFSLFLAAITVEIWIEWKHRLHALAWLAALVVSYGFLGLFVMPSLYGAGILVYVFLEPLVIIFIGGFAFAYARLFTGAIFFKPTLSASEVSAALAALPGWKLEGILLAKTFHFKTFVDSLNFVNKLAALGFIATDKFGFAIRFGDVDLNFRIHPTQGVHHRQLELAKKIEGI